MIWAASGGGFPPSIESGSNADYRPTNHRWFLVIYRPISRVDLDHILYDTDGEIATVTLNRPDRLNALSVQTWEELRSSLRMFA